MTAICACTSPSESPFRPRVFGARPFHCDGELFALRFASDGSLWSVEEPGLLRHWNPNARQQIGWHELGDPAAVWCFSTSANYVAAGSGELCLWETADGELRACWQQASWVTALAFQPNGLLLASGHDDGGVRLWDHARGRLAFELRPPITPSGGVGDLAVSALAFSLDGRRLAVAAEDRSIVIWNMISGEMSGRLLGHTDRISAVAWHPDCRRLVSAGWDATARVWDAAARLPLILLNSHDTQVQALSFSPDGRLLACADSAPAVHLWDMDTYRTLAVQHDHAREVRSLAFSPDGKCLASGGGERVIHVWNSSEIRAGSDSDGKSTVADATGSYCLATVADASGSYCLASLAPGTTLRVWNTTTAESALQLEDAPLLQACAASADGRWFAGSVIPRAGSVSDGSDDRNTLFLWRADNGRRERLFRGQAAPITVIAFAANSTLLAAATLRSSDVWLWTVPDGEPLILPDAVAGCSVEALAFHPHGRLLAIGGVDWLAPRGAEGRIVLWDLLERKLIPILPLSAGCLAFHPSGRLLAAATLTHSIVVWNLEVSPARSASKGTSEWLGHLDAVTCLAYSPDGRWLASGSDDRTLRLWDADSGQPCGLVELDTQIKALAFAPDGLSLFTGNGTTSCYQIALQAILTRNCSVD